MTGDSRARHCSALLLPRPVARTAHLREISMDASDISNIVLVHGAFVDGSGWEGVYKILKRDGYNVSIVQNPTIALDDDAAATKLVISQQDGAVLLVGFLFSDAATTE